MNGLERFLDINNIDKDELLNAVHLDIRDMLFEEICKRMKANNNYYIRVKKLYFSGSDLEATRSVVKRLCKCELSEDDTMWINRCIKAFLNKKDTRKAIPPFVKSSLLIRQNYKCAICRAPIDENNVHVDHIIPWDYVGDELEDNYQALCSVCNLHKSNHVAIAVSNIILHKTED